jgi:hypothetical protein
MLPLWFDQSLLCSTDTLFEKFKNNVVGNFNQQRLFFDNDGSILIVCHADTVIAPRFHHMFDNHVIVASGLDDRLGIMLAFHIVNTYDLKADILITDGEESCRSSAKYHELKKYNWIVELDRAGTDYVDYGLCSQDFHEHIQKTCKIELGIGSFSDISFIKTNSSCFNLGIGYYDPHDVYSYCIIEHVELAIERLIALYAAFGQTYFHHEYSNNWFL